MYGGLPAMPRGRLGGRGVSGLGRVGPHEPREAEVEDLEEAVGGEGEVRGLEVAVDDALVVGGLEAAGELAAEAQDVLLGERALAEGLRRARDR